LLARIVLILLMVAGIVLLLRWFVRTPPAQLARGLRRGALYAGIGLLILLAVTGRLPWLFAVAAAAIAVVQRLVTLWQLGNMARRVAGMAGGTGRARNPSAGQQSTIETRFLRVWLDHDSGAMGGAVLEGQYSGRSLDQLSLEELMMLLAECRADAQSSAVLEAYLDRVHGEAWREAAGGEEAATGPARPSDGKMTREEAYQVLGLEPGAGDKEVRDTHRRLMQKLHPDRGGSDYLAAKINQAKDILLGER
jgi:hypothetical protein